MESGRIVKFLIVIFVVLSLFFYILYNNEKKNQSALSEEFVKEAVINLSFRGVEVDSETIVRRLPDENIYVYEYSSDAEYTDTITEAFEKYLGSVAATKLQTPDGLSVTFKDKSNDDKNKGRLLFSNEGLSFSYTAEGSMTYLESSLLYNDNVDVDDNKNKTIENLIGSITIGKEMSYRVSGSRKTENFEIVSVVQTVNGMDIKDVYVNLSFEKNKLAGVYGTWITVKPLAAYHEKLIDGINVLYKLDLENISEVLSEKNMYSLRKGNDDKFFLVPCWEIVAVDNDGKIIKTYFDAL